MAINIIAIIIVIIAINIRPYIVIVNDILNGNYSRYQCELRVSYTSPLKFYTDYYDRLRVIKCVFFADETVEKTLGPSINRLTKR